MELVKQLLTYAILVAIVAAGFIYIPKITSRVQVPPDYSEITVPEVEHYPSYSCTPLKSVAELTSGDAVAYRVPNNEGTYGNGFGWVAGKPGDEIRIAGGQVLVNNRPFSSSGPLHSVADLGPLTVPENHVFVVTTLHTTDSIVRGPIPLSALRGRLEGFP